jgi:Mn-dependent DtxR family transcriptional regulator
MTPSLQILPQQYAGKDYETILELIEKEPGLSVVEIQDKTGINRRRVSRILKPLREKGVVAYVMGQKKTKEGKDTAAVYLTK